MAGLWGCRKVRKNLDGTHFRSSAPLTGFESMLRQQKSEPHGLASHFTLAESWGFEPQKGFGALTRLAGEHLRPLGQLSVTASR